MKLNSKVWGYIAFVAMLPYAVVKTLWTFKYPLGWSEQGVAELHMNTTLHGGPVISFLYSYGIDITAVLAVIASLLGLSLVRPWGERINKRLILWPAWIGGVCFTIIGLAAIPVLIYPEDNGMEAWVGYVVYGGFLLWGITICLAAVSYRRRISRNTGS